MNAIFTALVAEFMTKEGMGLVKGGNLPVIGSLAGGNQTFKPSSTPDMSKGEVQELPNR